MSSRTKSFLLISLAFLAVATLSLVAQSSLADFGLSQAELKTEIAGSFIHGNVSAYPSRKAYNAASPAVRAAFVRNVLNFVKAYTESAAFQADYAKQRAAAKPSQAASKGSPDEQLAKYFADQRQSVANMKKSVAQMPPDMQKQMTETVKQMEASIDQQQKDPKMMAMLKQQFAMSAAGDQNNHQKELAAYDQKYPADPRVLIAKRLREFLDLAKDVRFDAKLVPAGGGQMRFADPQYEAKSDQWKLCYRAGKEPVEAARAFAQEWLNQITKR